MSNINNLLSQHFQEIMKQHSERMKRIAEPLLNLQKLPVFEELQKNMQELSRLTEGITFKNQEAFAGIADLNNHTGLKALSEQMELIGKGLTAKLSVDLVNPILKDLQLSLNGIEISEDKLKRALEEIERTDFVSEFENKVSNVEKGHSTAQGVSIGLSEVLTFLMFILMLIQHFDNSTDKVLEKLSDGQDLTNQLIQRLVELNSNTPKLINKSKSKNHKLLIASQSVPLRSQPDINSDTLITLFIGQHLDLLEEKGEWYKVKFFDVSISDVDTGWIQKKYIIPEIEIGHVQTKKLGEVANYVNGRAFKPKEWKNEGLPIIRIQNLNDETAPYNYSDEEHKEKYKVQNGDLLFAWSASLGAYIWKGGDAWLNQHIFRVDHAESISKKYLYYCLADVVDELYAKSHGSGMVHVTKEKFEETEIPVPPLPTQHRIVEKIEELFSELDHGVENLKKAQEQLKTYRQAVLKDAFEGKLTKEWREQQENLPTPEELLQQIKAERKAHREHELAEWEKEVEQWEKDGKPGRKLNKPRKAKKLPEITEEDLYSLPEIPSSWRYTYLNDLGDLGRGKSKHRPRNDEKLFKGGTIPFIQTGEVKAANKYLRTFEETYNEFGLSQSKLWPKGTLCITIAANIAETAILDIDACFPDSIVGYTSYNSTTNKLFVYYFIQSVQKLLEAFAPATAQKNINLTTLENLLVPLCSLKEQKEIVNEIESRLSVVDQLELTIQENLQKAEALRQSILKKSFSGKLVENLK